MKSTFDTVTGKLKVKPKEEWSKVEGMHEAIVSKEVFQKAQEMITPQKAPSETRKQHYICGCCGRGLNRRNGTDLYCARGYFLEDDCECRVVKAKEPTLDGIVLKELAEENEKIIALTADLTRTSGLEQFAAAYPARLYNVGIAEENAVGMAAGLSDQGYIPFVSTFANFATLRANEFVRHFMAYMKCNVKLVGLSSGFAMDDIVNIG